MLASENPSASRLAWFLQALVINNKAKRRTKLGIRNLQDALCSGVEDDDPSRKLQKGLGWGPQYDSESGLVRIASTAAALKDRQPPKGIAAFVDDLLGGRLDPRTLLGQKGEVCPPREVWPLLSDWLQHKDFDKTVAAQLRPKKAIVRAPAELRATASDAASSVKSLKAKDSLEFVELSPDRKWARLKLGKITGWLRADQLDNLAALTKARPKPKTEAEVLASWGAPRLYAEVDGLRFYGARPRGEA
ncbi:MAG: hypothetical protein U1A78_33725 [Polyangia bacterium]